MQNSILKYAIVRKNTIYVKKILLFPAKDNMKVPASLPPHMQPPLPASLPTIIPVNSNHPSYHPTSPSQYPSPPVPAMSPVNISQTPPLVATSPALVTPTPVSGMVPIRNSLYEQPGLTSVLLQPLNEVSEVDDFYSYQIRSKLRKKQE